MLINVPQYIDVEDKIAGPLTAKQLFWMIGLGVVLLILWNILDKILFFLIGIPVGLIFAALAFYKPFGQPLPAFIFQGVLYMFRPKVYVWRRTFNPQINITRRSTDNKNKNVQIEDKHMSNETLHDLARVLDSEGGEHNENIEQWIDAHGQGNKKGKI